MVKTINCVNSLENTGNELRNNQNKDRGYFLEI